jgi:hypothetical protein
VVFGSFGKAWTLTESFLCSYLHTFRSKIHQIKISVSITDHRLFCLCSCRYHTNIHLVIPFICTLYVGTETDTAAETEARIKLHQFFSDGTAVAMALDPWSARMHSEIMRYFVFDCCVLPHFARPFQLGGTEFMVTHKMLHTSLLGDPCGPRGELVRAKKSDKQTPAILRFKEHYHKSSLLLTSLPPH